MKKLGLTLLVVAIFAIAFGTVSSAYAQTETPGTPFNGNENRTGAYGRFARGNRSGMMGTSGQLDGLMHDEIISVYAEKLGLSVEVLNERLEAGESMADIALSTGMTLEDFRALNIEVRGLAVEKALQNGKLTQEQAELMKARGSRMGNVSGLRGNWQGRYGLQECPNTQTTP